MSPDDRYIDAQQLFEDIENERLHLPLKYASEPIAGRFRKTMRRYPRVFSGSVLGCVAAVLLGIVGYLALSFWLAANTSAAQSKLRLVSELGRATVQQIVDFDSDPAYEGSFLSPASPWIQLKTLLGSTADRSDFLGWLPGVQKAAVLGELSDFYFISAGCFHEKLRASDINDDNRKVFEDLVLEVFAALS